MKILEKTENLLKFKPKIIIVAGTTASGKSSWAINLAKNELKGKAEIISADSRQIYQGLEYYSGAVLPSEEQGIKHHLISFLGINEKFSVFDFQIKAEKLVQEIFTRGNTPIIAGGSSFYLETIIYKTLLPEVKPNEKLRLKLAEKNTAELFQILKQKDFQRAENIDKKNKRRLIRALEIVEKLGKVPEIKKEYIEKYIFEVYYLDLKKEILDQKIAENFKNRLPFLLKEAEILRSKISAQQFKQLGLAFKFIFNFWDKKITKDKFIKLGIKEEQKYAKRQKTYLKKFIKNLPTSVTIRK